MSQRNYRDGWVTRKAILCEYDVELLDVEKQETVTIHRERFGNWNANKVFWYEYDCKNREAEETGLMFIQVKNYKERRFIVGQKEDQYFGGCTILREITDNESEIH